MTNPYQATSHNVSSSQAATGSLSRWGCVLLLSGPVSVLLSEVGTVLLDKGVLNTKDMAPLVGHETGSISEYMLNVWHWDAAVALLFAAAIPNTMLAFLLLRKRQPTSRR